VVSHSDARQAHIHIHLHIYTYGWKQEAGGDVISLKFGLHRHATNRMPPQSPGRAAPLWQAIEPPNTRFDMQSILQVAI
jgi:hypothetical protein